MKRIAALLTIAMFAVFAVPAAAADESEWRDNIRPDLRAAWDKLEGKAPPSLEEQTGWLNAPQRSWAELKGKVVIIDCWATWCGPCIQQIPKLQELHAKYQDKGLVILGVHSSNGHERMAGFVAEKELPWAFSADSNRVLYRELGVAAIPAYFVVDRHGKMRVAGADRTKLEEIIAALIEEEAEPADPRELIGKWPKPKDKRLFAENDLRGKQAPKLEVEQWIDGEPKTEGKMILINFWATWSEPSRAMIPKLNAWQEKFKDDLVVISISDESAAKIRDYAKVVPMDYANAVDSKGRMKAPLALQGIPHVLIIDTEGVVRWQGFPFSSNDRLSEDLIERLMKSDKVVGPRRLEATAKAEKKSTE